MLWSLAIAAGIITGILYLVTFPEVAAALAAVKKGNHDDDDDDEEEEGNRKQGGGTADSTEEESGQDCDKAWKKRLKVCDKIAKAREDLCASRRRITQAQKQIHSLKVAARHVHMQTITVTSNLTRELLDHHSSGQFMQAAQEQCVRTIQRKPCCSNGCANGNQVVSANRRESYNTTLNMPDVTTQQQQLAIPQQKKELQQLQTQERRISETWQQTLNRRSTSQKVKNTGQQKAKCSSCCGRRKRMAMTSVFEEDYISGEFIITFEDYIDKLIASSACKEIWGNECCVSNKVQEKFFQPPEEPVFDDGGTIDELLTGSKKKPVCEVTEIIPKMQDNWQDTELDVVVDKETEIGESFESLIKGEKSTSTSEVTESKIEESDLIEKEVPEENEPTTEEVEIPPEELDAGNVGVRFKATEYEVLQERSSMLSPQPSENAVVKESEGEVVAEKETAVAASEEETAVAAAEEETAVAAATEEEEYPYTLRGISVGEIIYSFLNSLLQTYLPEKEDRPLQKVVIDQVYVIDEDEEPPSGEDTKLETVKEETAPVEEEKAPVEQTNDIPLEEEPMKATEAALEEPAEQTPLDEDPKLEATALEEQPVSPEQTNDISMDDAVQVTEDIPLEKSEETDLAAPKIEETEASAEQQQEIAPEGSLKVAEETEENTINESETPLEQIEQPLPEELQQEITSQEKTVEPTPVEELEASPDIVGESSPDGDIPGPSAEENLEVTPEQTEPVAEETLEVTAEKTEAETEQNQEVTPEEVEAGGEENTEATAEETKPAAAENPEDTPEKIEGGIEENPEVNPDLTESGAAENPEVTTEQIEGGVEETSEVNPEQTEAGAAENPEITTEQTEAGATENPEQTDEGPTQNVGYFIKSIYDRSSEILRTFKKYQEGKGKETKHQRYDELQETLNAVLRSDIAKFNDEEDEGLKHHYNELQKMLKCVLQSVPASFDVAEEEEKENEEEEMGTKQNHDNLLQKKLTVILHAEQTSFSKEAVKVNEEEIIKEVYYDEQLHVDPIRVSDVEQEIAHYDYVAVRQTFSREQCKFNVEEKEAEGDILQDQFGEVPQIIRSEPCELSVEEKKSGKEEIIKYQSDKLPQLLHLYPGRFIEEVDDDWEIKQLNHKLQQTVCSEPLTASEEVEQEKQYNDFDLQDMSSTVVLSKPSKCTLEEEDDDEETLTNLRNIIHEETKLFNFYEGTERLNIVLSSRPSTVAEEDEISENFLNENDDEPLRDRTVRPTLNYNVPDSIENCNVNNIKQLFYFTNVIESNNSIQREDSILSIKKSTIIFSESSTENSRVSLELTCDVEQNENVINESNVSEMISSDISDTNENIINSQNEEKPENINLLPITKTTTFYICDDPGNSIQFVKCSVSSATSENVLHISDFCGSFDHFHLANRIHQPVNQSEINRTSESSSHLLSSNTETQMSPENFLQNNMDVAPENTGENNETDVICDESFISAIQSGSEDESNIKDQRRNKIIINYHGRIKIFDI